MSCRNCAYLSKSTSLRSMLLTVIPPSDGNPTSHPVTDWGWLRVPACCNSRGCTELNTRKASAILQKTKAGGMRFKQAQLCYQVLPGRQSADGSCYPSSHSAQRMMMPVDQAQNANANALHAMCAFRPHDLFRIRPVRTFCAVKLTGCL